jgi:predicted RNase H-like nuclease (RuvC/YqgF family)
MSETSGGGRETHSNEVDWPQVKDMLNERLADDKEARKLQREADNQRIEDLEKHLKEKAEGGDRELGLKVEGLKELVQQHQEMQKDQIDYAFRAAKEAITEQKSTNNALFEEQRRQIELLRNNLGSVVTKDSFSVVESELRDGNATTLQLVQDLATRQTAMESRGGGEKDHAAELRSNTALVVSVIAGFAAVAGVLLVLLTGI